jgi:ABC-type transport system involved in multi-copper enzyme maturation permease subunit
MRIAGIIHQQICQLRWHLLACLGLIMVLPVEEAVVNLRSGGGFYSVSLAVAAVTFGPLLAGLIACANVQADLDQKRYIFWRSKPANVKLLMTVKFFVGLIASLIVLACPAVFAIATVVLFAKERIEREPMYSMPFLVLIAVMTYSLCFACNVLVRKSARAWLIGMLLAGLLLVLPFVLPLNYKDLVTDTLRWTLSAYLAIVLGASAAAFVFSLYATQHDWHLRTNLKGLLWVGAGLLFVLMMLFSSQVANIKVLQEKQIDSSWGQSTLDNFDNRIILQGRSYVDVDKGGISLRQIGSFSNHESGVSSVHGSLGIDSTGRRIIQSPRPVGYRTQSYPWYGHLYKSVDGQIYSFSIIAYYQIEREGHLQQRIYEKIYLRSYKVIEKDGMPVNELDELDISDCLTNRKDVIFLEAMRLIGNVIVVCVNRSYLVVDVTDPGELKRIDTKLDALKYAGSLDRQKEFAIPLVPVEGIGTEERIRLSIDLNCGSHYGTIDIRESSIVDVHEGKIAFFIASDKDVARFDVTRWDQDRVYCRFSTARPFTILESIGGLYFRGTFVKGGNLYCYGQGTLLVFDISSNRRIRKLGHFVRMDYNIEDIVVLDDGNILLSMRWERNFSRSDPDKPQKSYLCLLKNPA